MMTRPPSIVAFERCYLGAWVIGFLSTLTHWTALARQMGMNPAVAALGPAAGQTMVLVSVAINAAITALLWYFVTRKAAVVAKWVVTVLFALALALLLFNLAMGQLSFGLSLAISLVTLALQGAAVMMLFRPDARRWFGEATEEPGA